jgi:hypothetical protein
LWHFFCVLLDKNGVKDRIVIKKWIKIVTVAVLILVTGVIILNTVIRRRISQQLQSLSSSIQISYSSVHCNLLTASVSFDELEINFIPYKNLPASRHTLHFLHASLKGINFFKLLFSKKFSVNRLRLEKGDILLDQFLLAKKDSAQTEIFEQIKMPFKDINIHHFELSGMKACLNTDSSNPPLVTGDHAIHTGTKTPVSVYVKSLQIDHLSVVYKDRKQNVRFTSAINVDDGRVNNIDGRLSFATVKCNLSDFHYSGYTNHHNLVINKIERDSEKEIIRIYNLNVIPQYG